jgi:hypothetical protein
MASLNAKLGNPINHAPPPCALLFAAVLVVCFALFSIAQAVVPAPDGGYPFQNTAEGDDALFSLTTGQNNTAIGYHALYSNTDGRSNTATGDHALEFNISGFGNAAVGSGALGDSHTASFNTAIGFATLRLNTTGEENAAVGYLALYRNTRGDNNTATGVQALENNRTGSFNTASGGEALQSNTTGTSNTAVGYTALLSNTTGGSNTAIGLTALGFNTTGNHNVAAGASALVANATGEDNTAAGYLALYQNTVGNNNIALGNLAGGNLTSGSNNIAIGNEGVAGESGAIRIGTQGTQTSAFIAGIRGVPLGGLQPVGVNASGQLGVRPSSARFKDAIKPMNDTSEAIFSLQPVTFRYKGELGSDGAPQFGLVAEEVAKVSPDLVVRDDQGRPFTVRYEAINTMLLNEFLKAHCKVENLEATVAEQQKQIKALITGLQQVSDQLVLSRPARQVVLNDR